MYGICTEPLHSDGSPLARIGYNGSWKADTGTNGGRFGYNGYHAEFAQKQTNFGGPKGATLLINNLGGSNWGGWDSIRMAVGNNDLNNFLLWANGTLDKRKLDLRNVNFTVLDDEPEGTNNGKIMVVERNNAEATNPKNVWNYFRKGWSSS